MALAGFTAAARVLKERAKDRNLPSVELPQVESDELARTLQGMQEHFRMYEGDSGAPRERFVTIAELENAGLIKSDTKSGFAYISQIMARDVAQQAGSTANPTLTDPVKRDTSRQSRVGSGGGTPSKSTSTATTQKLNDSQDVNVNKPAKNEFLQFDGSQFKNFSLFNAQNRWNKRQLFEKEVGIRELLASPAVAPGYALLYARDDQVLYYKDSAGVEHPLFGAPGGLPTGTVDNSMLRWDVGNQAWEEEEEVLLLDNGHLQILGVATGGTNGSPLLVRSTNPQFTIQDTDAATDAQVWNWVALSNTLSLRLLDDAYLNPTDIISFTRSTTTPVSVDVTGMLSATGRISTVDEVRLVDPLDAADYISLRHNAVSNIFEMDFVNVPNWAVTGVNLITMNGASFDMTDGGDIFIRGPGNSAYAQFAHDDTDMAIAGVNSTDLNITGFTSIDIAASIDATGQIGTTGSGSDPATGHYTRIFVTGGESYLDAFEFGGPGFQPLNIRSSGVTFNAAITATSYEGILAANMLSRIANESIPGGWTFDTTNIGKSTVSIETITTGNWDKVQGYSRMVSSASTGEPSGATHGYYFITARRDTAGGFGAFYQEYSTGRVWSGYNTTGGDPTWVALVDDFSAQTIAGLKAFTDVLTVGSGTIDDASYNNFFDNIMIDNLSPQLRFRDGTSDLFLDYDGGIFTITNEAGHEISFSAVGDLTIPGDLTVNEAADTNTAVRIGEASVLRGDSADGALTLYGEQSGVIRSVTIQNSGSNYQHFLADGLQRQDAGGANWIWSIFDGVTQLFYGPSDVNSASFHHDDTDFTLSGNASTVDFNITGFTAIQAGTVNADFASLSATNLVVDTAATGALDIQNTSVGNESILLPGTAALRRTTNQGGLALWCDSSLLLHAGDNVAGILSDLGIVAGSTGETVYLTADTGIQLISNRQTSFALSYIAEFNNAGHWRVFDQTGVDVIEMYHNGTQGVINSLAGNLDLIAAGGIINMQDIVVAPDFRVTGYGAAGTVTYGTDISPDQDTGMYGESSNVLAFSSGGVRRLQLYSAVANFAVPLRVAGAPFTKTAGFAGLSADFLYIDGKEAIDGNDTYLRLNQNVDFSTGVYTPGALWTASTFRADGAVTINDTLYVELGANFDAAINTDFGIHGGYIADGAAFGATIWTIGAAWLGGTAGVDSSNSPVYGIRWLRGSHTSARSDVGEGLYVMVNGTIQAGIGSLGIYTDLHLRVDGNIDLNGNIVGDGASTITGIETLTIDSTGDITKASHGNYLYHQSTIYNDDQEGGITFDTGDPTGGADGDIWFKYTA